jgi:hypothetical protein
LGLRFGDHNLPLGRAIFGQLTSVSIGRGELLEVVKFAAKARCAQVLTN